MVLNHQKYHVTTAEEAETQTDRILSEVFKLHTVPELGLLRAGIVSNLLLCLNAASYTDVGELVTAFNSFKVAVRTREPSLKVVEIINDILYIRIPDVRNKSEDMKMTLASYIYFAKILLNKSDDKTKIVIDHNNLGDVCHCTAKTKKAMDELIAASRSSTGLTGGQVLKFPSGISGPACAIIAAIRCFNAYHPLFKKLSKKATTLNMLKDSISNVFGLKDPNMSSFGSLFVRQTLGIATRPTTMLPAGFGNALKSENKVTSPEGIMAKLGFVRINVDVNKVIKIARLGYTHTSGRINDLVVDSSVEGLPHDKHFHSAVKMLLPYLTKTKKQSFKSQINRANADLSKPAREFYLKQSGAVDDYCRAYAFLSSSLKDKKKTKPAAVIAAASKAANNCVDLPYTLRNGRTVQTYMELKYSYRQFLEKLLGRRASPAKRKECLLDSDNDDDGGKPAASVKIPNKRAKTNPLPDTTPVMDEG